MDSFTSPFFNLRIEAVPWRISIASDYPVWSKIAAITFYSGEISLLWLSRRLPSFLGYMTDSAPYVKPPWLYDSLCRLALVCEPDLWVFSSTWPTCSYGACFCYLDRSNPCLMKANNNKTWMIRYLLLISFFRFLATPWWLASTSIISPRSGLTTFLTMFTLTSLLEPFNLSLVANCIDHFSYHATSKCTRGTWICQIAYSINSHSHLFLVMVTQTLHYEVRMWPQLKFREAHIFIWIHFLEVFEFFSSKEVIFLSLSYYLTLYVGIKPSLHTWHLNFLPENVFFIFDLQLVLW